MTLMQVYLELDEYLLGIFSIIWVAIGLIIGLTMIYKYVKLKERVTIYIAVTIIFLTSPWWGAIMQFISILTTHERIPDILYVAIGQVFLPVTCISWIVTITKTTWPHLMKKIVLVYVIIYAIYEIFLIFGLIYNFEALIGVVDDVRELNTSYRIVPLIFSAIAIITMAGGGILMARILLRSDDEIIRWKARFLIIGFISLAIGTMLDVGLLDEIHDVLVRTTVMIIARMFLITGSIEIYLGFFLPEQIAKKLVK